VKDRQRGTIITSYIYGLKYYFLPESIALECQGAEPGTALKMAHWSSHDNKEEFVTERQKCFIIILNKKKLCINSRDKFARNKE
jgi:hypothetical protein